VSVTESVAESVAESVSGFKVIIVLMGDLLREDDEGARQWVDELVCV